MVGDLTGIRYDNDTGRYVKDNTHKIPFTNMGNYLTYKARLAGLECLVLNEADTSLTC